MGNIFRLAILCAAFITILACKGVPDERAQKLYDLATHYGEQNDYQQTVEILQKITIDFPDSDLAKKAEEEIPEYQGLERLFIENKRKELLSKLISLSRTLENYHTRYLSYPLAVTDLEKLPTSFVKDFSDSWENPIHYKPTYSSDNIPRHAPDGYVLASFGKDGLPGGSGPDKDSFYKKDSQSQRGQELGQIFGEAPPN